MPLTGEAKRESERVHMRMARRAVSDAKRTYRAITGKVLKGAALQSVASHSVAQQMLQDALARNGLTLDLTLNRIRELHEAERPYGKEATPGPDNDARARACELAMRLGERAGLIPSVAPDGGPTSSGARVRMVQIEPDGTERILEIG